MQKKLEGGVEKNKHKNGMNFHNSLVEKSI